MNRKQNNIRGIGIILIGLIIPTILAAIAIEILRVDEEFLFFLFTYILVIFLGISQFFKRIIPASSDKINLYFEYRKWVFFWGLFLDGKREVQKSLDAYNEKNWKVKHFEWNSSWKFGIFRIIFILIISVLSFGILSYWSGFSIIFESKNEH